MKKYFVASSYPDVEIIPIAATPRASNATMTPVLSSFLSKPSTQPAISSLPREEIERQGNHQEECNSQRGRWANGLLDEENIEY